MINIALTSDKHAGSATGLTTNPQNKIQEKLLSIYEADCEWLGKVDYHINLGDIIDGEDKKSRDLTCEDITEQIDEAVNLELMVKAKEHFLIAGTPYHVGSGGQHWDKGVVRSMAKAGAKASYHRKLKLLINDWFLIQARHKTGSSSVPHGRHTSPSRSKTWDAINAAINSNISGEACKLANLLVFGHVHYWTYCEDAQGAAMTMPCYQALGGKYGDTDCDGHIDIGCVKLCIGDKGEWSWDKNLHRPKMISRTVKR